MVTMQAVEQMARVERLETAPMRLADVGAALVSADAREWMQLGLAAGEAVERAARRLRSQVDAACVTLNAAGVL